MQYQFLNKVNKPEDVQTLNTAQKQQLCAEIRDCLIQTVAKHGGHLASNLGVVELTVALHSAFHCPQDSIIFDVGHQCYTHKLLTGRYAKFSTLRQEGGLSGFMRPDESIYDPFVTGHSSNSISAALGIYKAKQLAGQPGYVISVVGDGAMTGGMIYEALNNAGSGKNAGLIVVLNDNKMSISRNVGGLARYLNLIRSKPGYHRFKHRLEALIARVPLVGKCINRNLLRSKTLLKNAIYHSNIFEDMGFHYLGPVNGHDLNALQNIFAVAKEQKRPVLVHVLTQKGKGYEFAEKNPNNYHGVSSFNIEQGAAPLKKVDFSAVCGDELCRLAATDEKLCVVTAAMTAGTGLTTFAQKFKNRFFDVGIAEEHATTFAAGLAAAGAHPVFVVYSSFLQRGYDQLIHDAAIANWPVTFCVDRAGMVGEDGETHQGLFDAAFLKTIPNFKVFAPANYLELKLFLNRAIYQTNGPCAVRYPRGQQPLLPSDYTPQNEDYAFYGNGNAKILLVTYGRLFANACKCYEALKAEGVDLAVVKLNCIAPIAANLFPKILRFQKIAFFEEGMQTGGINESLIAGLQQAGYQGRVKVFAVNGFVPHQPTERALQKFCLDADSMRLKIKEMADEKV